jgi:hypothetical protein
MMDWVGSEEIPASCRYDKINIKKIHFMTKDMRFED